jgi:hypothetical protein
MPAAYASEAQRRGWRGEFSRGPRGAGCGVKARGPARGEANKGGTVVGNALMTSAQKRPQGLKPPRLPRDLRGPEGPLFHGAAGSAAMHALTVLRAVGRGPHWAHTASLDPRIGRSGKLRLYGHGWWRPGQQDRHGGRQCAHDFCTETTSGAKAPTPSTRLTRP